MVYVVWNDTKCVSVISNEHPSHSEGTVLRNVKKNAGVNEKKDVPIPAIVYSYNCLMNDVDLFDELIKYYNILHQTRKCWKTFLHFVEIAIVNSYIIYKEVHPRGKLSHFNFRKTLVILKCRFINQLLGDVILLLNIHQ